MQPKRGASHSVPGEAPVAGLDILVFVAALIVVIFIGIAGLIILWQMVFGPINLEKLISEPDGSGASLSRFQFLVFTFVIAMSLFLIVIGQAPPHFPTGISPDVLGLLGISDGSYVISKGIQKSADKAKASKGTDGKDDGDKGKEEKPKDAGA